MTIYVRSFSKGQVVLWERDPVHPGGEIFIAGAGVCEVGRTPAVEARLRRGTLVLEGAMEHQEIAELPDVVAVPEPDPEPVFPPLTAVNGIGKKAAEKLVGAYVNNTGDLAALCEDDLFVKAISERTGYSEAKLIGWAEQAKEMVA